MGLYSPPRGPPEGLDVAGAWPVTEDQAYQQQRPGRGVPGKASLGGRPGCRFPCFLPSPGTGFWAGLDCHPAPANSLGTRAQRGKNLGRMLHGLLRTNSFSHPNCVRPALFDGLKCSHQDWPVRGGRWSESSVGRRKHLGHQGPVGAVPVSLPKH